MQHYIVLMIQTVSLNKLIAAIRVKLGKNEF